MTSYTGREVFDALKQNHALMQHERKEWHKVSQSLAQSVAAMPREIDDAWSYLCEIVVPSLDAHTLDDAAAQLALPHITAAQVAARREKDRVDNATQLDALARDPLFVEREGRRNAAHIRIAEVEDALAPLNDSLSALRQEPAFDELITINYGVASYPYKFWQTSYYRHWQLADGIVERHGARLRVEDFLGVRNKYLAESDALRPLEAVRAEQRELLERIARMEQTHAQTIQALTALDARSLAWTRGRVRQHLGALPAEEMARLLEGRSASRIAGTRVLGLIAKQAYLEEMNRQVLQPFDEEARATLADVESRIAKMSLPKKWGERMDAVTFQKRTARRSLDKWSTRRTQLERARRSLQDFDRYDRYSTARDFVWWSVMTDGRYQMPFARRDEGDPALWGRSDEVQLAAAEVGSRARDRDGSRGRDFS